MATQVGILGFGKMGEAVALGLMSSSKSSQFKIQGTTRSEKSAQEVSQRLGIACFTQNEKLAETCDVLLLSVKPHQAEKVLQSIAPRLKKNQLLISLCASLTTQQLSQWSGGEIAVIRAMPNTPCLIGQGMTVFCTGPGAGDSHREIVETIFQTLGKTAMIEESLMDGATGLSGCGPAYAYLIIESLSEAGVKVGLPRKVATLLAAQTLAGAAEMVLQRKDHPAALKDEVTTPAGCTIDGLMALEEGKLRVTLIKAVLAAAHRSRILREG
jgi:pyrroline-5-carboxylate reductase